MYIKNTYTFIIFLLLFLFGWHFHLLGQTTSKQQKISEILNKSRHTYGPDEMLENGRFYIPPHPRAKGNPYFAGNNWKTADLNIKGDIFIDIGIKYNVNLEQVILKKVKENQESHIPVILNSNFIDSFVSEGHHFINLNTIPNVDELSGFAELIYNGRFIFFVKHSKEFLNRYSQSNSYGDYSKLYSVCYIYKGEQLTRMGTKRAFISYFEPIAKEIKKFLRKHNIKYNKATTNQLNQLVKFCDEKSH